MARVGDSGPVVDEVRARLIRLEVLPPEAGHTYDGAMDAAVRAFQQAQGLSVDGIVGPETFRRLEEARWRLGDRVLSYTPGHMLIGDDTMALQRRLLDMGFDAGRVDGVFGPDTDRALRDFQRNVGLEPDGICGPATMRALDRLTRTVSGGRPEQLREELLLRGLRTGTADKVIVLDPGHGGNDPGHQCDGLSEQSIVDDICSRLEGGLTAIGTQVLLTRPLGVSHLPAPTDAERAAFANRVRADLMLSVHVDWDDTGSGHGVATFYYGTRSTSSAMGRRFAELVQDRVVAASQLQDCHAHAKTWDLLRLTGMPCVRIEVGYLSHPGDAARLTDPGARQTVASSMAEAIQAFFAPGPP